MIDLHNDALLKLPTKQLLKYLEHAKSTGVDEIWLSVWTTELTNPLSVIAKKRKLLDSIANQPQYPVCRLHIEDAWFLTETNLDELIALKPHSIGLTWNHANQLAGGTHSRKGITQLGYHIISRLETAGIQIDTAHLNRRSFWQFARVTTRPLICTHTALHVICHHPRNLTNRQIRTIIQSSGFIGLALVPKFLTKNTTYCGIHDLVKHIIYFKQHFNIKSLYWGTDFYGTEHLPLGIRQYQDLTYLFQAEIIGHSVLRQPIIAYQFGNFNAPHRLLITAGMHAREWIGSLALHNWLTTNPKLPDNFCIIAVTYCNPDGVLLATQGDTHLSHHRQKLLYRINHNSHDYSLWKANSRAVDLNVNFNAGWGQGRTNLNTPASANYIGKKPNSEPENRALLTLIQRFRPTVSLALHTKGNVIYYSRSEDQQTAEDLAKLVNFQAILSYDSYGGLTDYLALKQHIPSFTIELGDDAYTHPLTCEQLPTIMPALQKIINYFLTGE